MAISQKQRQALLNSRKKRLQRPTPAAVVKKLTMKSGERNRYTSKHAQVLLAIETTIVRCFQSDDSLDDATVALALTAAIHPLEPPEAAGVLCHFLGETCRALGLTANDQIWIDGLRAIYTSVCDVGNTHPGGRSYLQKAQAFVPQQ